MSRRERSLDRSGGRDHRWSPWSPAEVACEKAEEDETVSEELAAFQGLSACNAGG